MARYEKGRKEETHLRVVKAASERFRKDGVDGVGVATLMNDVGLTHGGFYAHFASKDALVKEAALFAFGASPDAMLKDDETPFDLRAFIEVYASPQHRDHPEKGCPLAAIGSDLARRPKDTRLAVTKKVQELVGQIGAALTDDRLHEQERAGRAHAILAQVVGAVQMSRIVTSRTESDMILAAGKVSALQLAGLLEASPTTPWTVPSKQVKR
ncbi:TetR/AcrR family transcriptional regulator [Beijerinckia sp. L45]|uniref:TetR/AcrR family transcriptional regulator n=1 Tax=Beijerinckia sp. L45 TaxID=1641855 RepID=UPI00131C6966|nr:TetR/AcrR family transcriptional regulator [Beijerinckia sp. L45]